jgi:HAD superfamily hydrolase (TIGR01509 family)
MGVGVYVPDRRKTRRSLLDTRIMNEDNPLAVNRAKFFQEPAKTPLRKMESRAKAIFFDLGETLVTQNVEDSMITKKALHEISELIARPVSPRTLFQLYMKGYRINDSIRSEYNVEIPIQAWMTQLLRKVIGHPPTDTLVNKCISIIVKARAANAVAFDDAAETIRQLQRKRLKLAVISNVSSHEVALAILKHVRLTKYFDLVVTSALTGIRKPDPGIFRYTLCQLGIKPHEAAIVGDSERHDIQGGHIAGLQTVLINRKRQLEASLADHQFKTLAEALPTLQSL